ncbi:hypothetical protein [Bifidobacterium crudilactis]|uniref:hypothetical protein n=1 Tax=Bifidobacterium crudilactis TaxID=327277 RepID=UPI002648EA4C|nr:hypothetical protein [Bifidobacterium crudilactis]MDN5973544.1 hypothetical protein [Bifidobacterium crudilactis]MDN6210417.1 hypothetical protein [Bifidobacterium crudilactis]MDN6817303.1 hypothetical protein [Bifidobacterium crudilactis]MDN6832085.1 hypothetical protein [Bifidobacterium crudilactis]
MRTGSRRLLLFLLDASPPSRDIEGVAVVSATRKGVAAIAVSVSSLVYLDCQRGQSPLRFRVRSDATVGDRRLPLRRRKPTLITLFIGYSQIWQLISPSSVR